MKARLSEYEKIYIIKFYDLKTLGRLAEELQKPRSTIYFFYRKWLATKTIINQNKKCGRRKLLTNAEINKIKKYVDKNPLSTSREIRNLLKIKCGISTIQRTLKNLGFKNLRYRHKPILSRETKEKRLLFAKKYQNWTVRKWKKVLFTDESSVQVGKVYLRKIWVKPCNRLKPGFYLPKNQDYGKKYVKVWSCFSYKGVGKLHFIEDGWNRHVYKGILNDRLKIEANRLIGREFTLQEDGDKVHKSKVCQTWKRKNKIQVLDWPPSSCDISPLENLWGIFKKRLSLEKNPSNIQQFKELAEKVWSETPVSICEKLIESVPSRIQAVLDNEGGVTKY